MRSAGRQDASPRADKQARRVQMAAEASSYERSSGKCDPVCLGAIGTARHLRSRRTSYSRPHSPGMHVILGQIRVWENILKQKWKVSIAISWLAIALHSSSHC